MAQEGQTTNQPSLGQRLAAQRELTNLSIDSVAAELRLTSQRIVEIEKDDYSHTAGKAYARGYVYNYARYLDLPLDDIMAQFEKTYRIATPSPKPIETKFLFTNKPITTGHPYVRWVTLFMILVLVGLVIVWASNRYDHLFESQNTEVSELIVESVEEVPVQEGAASSSFPSRVSNAPEGEASLDTPNS